METENIKAIITSTFCGEMRVRLLDFIDYLILQGMQFERATDYWEKQQYWMIKYNDEYVCFLLLNGVGDEKALSPLTIWTDDSGSNWFEHYSIDEQQKELAWSNVDYCVHCGACSGGKRKNIFGREFSNVCKTTMRFVNPDLETLEFIKKIIDIRKEDITQKKPMYKAVELS